MILIGEVRQIRRTCRRTLIITTKLISFTAERGGVLPHRRAWRDAAALLLVLSQNICIYHEIREINVFRRKSKADLADMLQNAHVYDEIN